MVLARLFTGLASYVDFIVLIVVSVLHIGYGVAVTLTGVGLDEKLVLCMVQFKTLTEQYR